MSEFTVVRDDVGEFRWMLVAKDGEVVATSAVGYPHQSDCVDAIQRVKREASGAQLNENYTE